MTNNDWIQKDTAQIKKWADEIRKNYKALLVIGVGGSYAGACAGIELLGDGKFPVEFLGISYDAALLQKIIRKYKKKNFAVLIISKSGKTYEVISAFNIIEKILHDRYGKNYCEHIYAITGKDGYCRDFVIKHNIKCLDHPDVGGRYSVLTVTGLVPMAVAGLNIDEILAGAKEAETAAAKEITKYAVSRFNNYKKGKAVEVFAVGSVNAEAFGRWFQQLFSESEGKDGLGMWTSVAVYSRDLHSVGQFIQQGSPIISETILEIRERKGLKFNDGKEALNKCSVADIRDLNKICIKAAAKAHKDAGIPVIVFSMKNKEHDLGYRFYFFMAACSEYCKLLGVNAFDQPGVENYKAEMRNLLK
jgi:glucose-6-phosphate isomerase